MYRVIGLFLAVFVILVGCGPSRSGRMFPLETVRSFTVNQATKADVRAQMGEPETIKTQPDGLELWTYQHSQAHMTGTFTKTLKTNTQIAVFAFQGNLLTDLQWSLVDTESKGTIAGGKAGQPLDVQAMRALPKGKTTLKEVEAQFGVAPTRHFSYDGTQRWVYVHTRTGQGKTTATLEFDSNQVLTDVLIADQ